MKKQSNPLQYVSRYSLDLFCDHFNINEPYYDFPHTFFGKNFSDCAKQAKEKGWKLHRKLRTATCPLCMKEYYNVKRK